MKALFVTLDLALFFYNMLGKNSTARSPSRVQGNLSPRTVPAKNPFMRVISNTEGYLRGQFAGTIRGDNLRGRITSLLLYILVPVPVKYPPMELRELHTRGRGRVSPVPVPVKYPPMELGG